MITGGIKLPKSCLKVLGVLSSSIAANGISQRQLIDQTGLSERAVKYALKRLIIGRLISEQAFFGDMRRKLYFMEVRK